MEILLVLDVSVLIHFPEPALHRDIPGSEALVLCKQVETLVAGLLGSLKKGEALESLDFFW